MSEKGALALLSKIKLLNASAFFLIAFLLKAALFYFKPPSETERRLLTKLRVLPPIKVRQRIISFVEEGE